MTAPPTLAQPTALCTRCRHTLTADPRADGSGFGFSRDTDPEPMPVPDGVVLIFLTGRTPEGTR